MPAAADDAPAIPPYTIIAARQSALLSTAMRLRPALLPQRHNVALIIRCLRHLFIFATSSTARELVEYCAPRAESPHIHANIEG